MNWQSPADFFAMGGYGLYVWGSYAVTLACLLAEPLLARRRHRAAAADVRTACDAAGAPDLAGSARRSALAEDAA